MSSADRFRVDVEALRPRHPIDRVVQSYGVDLRRAGNALVGRCPFHSDSGRPNLYVYCRSGRWICYRCDKRGDAISFVQEIEDVSFKDAAARLSGQPDPRPARQRRHQRLVIKRRPRGLQSSATWDSAAYDVLAAATELYANRLLTDEAALAYMARRGFRRDILEQYRVGYASGDELVAYLRWQRLPVGAALRTGLLTSDGHEALAGRVTLVEMRDGRQPPAEAERILLVDAKRRQVPGWAAAWLGYE